MLKSVMDKFVITYEEAVTAAGGFMALAAILDITPSAVSQIKAKGFLSEGRSYQLACFFPDSFPALKPRIVKARGLRKSYGEE